MYVSKLSVGGACVGNVTENTSQYLYNKVCNEACSSHPHLVNVELLLLEGLSHCTIYLTEIT